MKERLYYSPSRFGRGDAQVQVTADVNPSFASRENHYQF